MQVVSLKPLYSKFIIFIFGLKIFYQFIIYIVIFTVQEMCGFKIQIGRSLKAACGTLSVNNLTDILTTYKEKSYLILPDLQRKILYVALKGEEDAETVISSYVHAVFVGIALSHFNNFSSVSKIIFICDTKII